MMDGLTKAMKAAAKRLGYGHVHWIFSQPVQVLYNLTGGAWTANNLDLFKAYKEVEDARKNGLAWSLFLHCSDNKGN